MEKYSPQGYLEINRTANATSHIHHAEFNVERMVASASAFLLKNTQLLMSCRTFPPTVFYSSFIHFLVQ